MRALLFIFSFIFAAHTADAQSFISRYPSTYSNNVAWGDSLTDGNQDGSGVTYPNVLATLYGTPVAIINDGVGGNTSSQILTRFLAAPTTWGLGTLIWSGRNDYDNGALVQSNIATMVGDLTTPHYLVLSIINGEYATYEYVGGVGYNQIVAINSALSSTYGSRYLDVRAMLVAAYNPANGADVLDHTHDVPPFTLRAVDASGTIVGAINSSTCTFTTSNTISTNFILTIGTEYIYISNVTGNTSVTGCTRGYGGTVAASYSPGQAYVGTDPIHLNAAGYMLVANYVYRAIQQLGGWRQ